MEKQIEGMRAGVFPIEAAAVADARARLAPPDLLTIKEMFGAVTVGSSHPTGDFATEVDRRGPLDLNAPPTPSDENPPTHEEALAAKVAQTGETPKFVAGSRYAVRFNKRVEFEKDFWLSPDQVHVIDGAFASEHEADIDAATEVTD